MKKLFQISLILIGMVAAFAFSDLPQPQETEPLNFSAYEPSPMESDYYEQIIILESQRAEIDQKIDSLDNLLHVPATISRAIVNSSGQPTENLTAGNLSIKPNRGNKGNKERHGIKTLQGYFRNSKPDNKTAGASDYLPTDSAGSADTEFETFRKAEQTYSAAYQGAW